MSDKGRELFDLTGRVAVITGSGANGGLGHAMALGLARFGADIVSSDIDEPGAKTTAEEVRALGRRSIAVRCDVSQEAEIARLFAEVDKTFGRVDILVNNAFRGLRAHPEDVSLEDWNKVMAASLTGYFLCAQQAGQRMICQGHGGSIINISSIAGSLALGRGNFVYSVAKGGVNQFTRELAVEWAHHGIRVNAIAPAQTLTPSFRTLLVDPQFDSKALLSRLLSGIPLNRLGEPEDFVGPVVFLASDASAFVTGVLLPVDGGNLALNAGGSHTWPKA